MKTQEKQTDALIIMKALEKEASPNIKRISNLTISSQDDYATAATLLKMVKNLAAQAKDKEDSLTSPLKNVIADIKTLFVPFRNTVAALEIDTKAKMLAFVISSQKKIAVLESKFESGEIKKVGTLIAKTNALEISSNVRKIWTAIEVDGTQTPREYMVPDVTAIREALKTGKKVKGWEWKQVESIAI